MRDPKRRTHSYATPGQNPAPCPSSEYDPLYPLDPTRQVVRPMSGFRDFACGHTFRFKAGFTAAALSLRVQGPTIFEAYDIDPGDVGTTPAEVSMPCLYSSGEAAGVTAGKMYDATLDGPDFFRMPTRFLLREVGNPPSSALSVASVDHPYVRALSSAAAFLPGKAALTAVRNTFGVTYPISSDKWRQGVLAPNGKIYGVPFGALNVLIINTLASTASTSTMGVAFSGLRKWAGGVLAANGKIYCAPHRAASVLVINPATDTAVLKTATDLGLPATALDLDEQYQGAILAPDGKIYCIPYQATDVLIIDPETDTAVQSTMGAAAAVLSGPAKWAGGVLGLDGKIYCAPYSAAKFLVIDPAAGTARDDVLPPHGGGGATWMGGGLARDGRIIFTPRTATDFIIINPVTKTMVRSTLGLTFPTEPDKWMGANVLPDGRILMTPRAASGFAVISADLSSATMTSMGLTLGSDAFFGGTMVGSRMFCLPHDASEVLVVSGWINAFSDQFNLSPFVNRF